MTWSLKLDQFSHDLRIGPDGKFERVRGSDEVRQRVRVAVWHYFQEYYLNTPNGVPWYENILGRKSALQDVSSIIRARILRVPGVIRIVDFSLDYNSLSRLFELTGEIEVESGPGEISTITNINIQVEN